MMKLCKKINLQEPQRNRNATANFVNLIRTSTVSRIPQTPVNIFTVCQHLHRNQMMESQFLRVFQ